jgi:predicted DsbA family dithiol-disulfide isomerase
VRLAAEAALDPQAARADLRDAARRNAVRDEDASARSMGVEGVPFFVFDRRLAVSGAHEPELLIQAIERAAQVPG